MMSAFRIVASVLVLALAACAGPSQRAGSAPPPSLTPEQMVGAIEAAAGSGESELAVQPLRDPMVEDLRQQAGVARAQARYAAAAAALERALAIVADDPALLQERAEIALLQRDFERAGSLAERAFELGAKVGPLCRRHWATIQQVRMAAGDAAGAGSAARQVQGCTVAAPERY